MRRCKKVEAYCDYQCRGRKRTPLNGYEKLWETAITDYGEPLARLAGGYEADPDRRQDLLQQIHIEIWRSLKIFSGKCSLRTWVYRVAHNVAASHVLRNRRIAARLVSLDSLETELVWGDGQADADRTRALSKLFEMIRRLKPLDRQIFLLYLEGESTESIAEIVGLTPSNVGVKLHRIRAILIRRFREGDVYAAERSKL